jgi:O-antigen ligase
MSQLPVALLTAIAVVTYSLDVWAIEAGMKMPLAVLITMLTIFSAVCSAILLGVGRGTLASLFLWLLITLGWLLSSWTSQSVSDTAVRLLIYSTAIIAAAWLSDAGLEQSIVLGMLLGVAMVVGVGFYRFVTLTGGLPAEHLLGYWGIKYLPSTRNGDAFYPLVGLGLAIAAYRGANRPATWSLLALILMFGVAIVLSSSRSAWLVMLLLLYINMRSSWTVRTVASTALAAGLVPILVIVTLPETGEVMKDRALSIFGYDEVIGSSNEERFGLLSASASVALAHPLGTGIGNFSESVGVRSSSDGALFNHAENLLATVAVEQGLLGLLVYLALTALLASSMFRGRGATAALAAVAFGHSLLNYEVNSWFYWMVIGAALAAPLSTQPVQASRSREPMATAAS